MKGLWRTGDPMIWLTGGALAFALLMVAGLVFLVVANGLGFFWPHVVSRLTLADGTIVIGEIVQREPIPRPVGALTPALFRIKVKQGNRDIHGNDFVWIDEARISKFETPSTAVAVERREWGNLYGFVSQVKDGEVVVAQGEDAAWTALVDHLPAAIGLGAQIRRLERDEIGRINFQQERIRLALRRVDLQGRGTGAEAERLKAEAARWTRLYDERLAELNQLKARETVSVVFRVADGQEKAVPLSQIVDVLRPNAMSAPAKIRTYAGRLWGFVSGDPRESNTEGGVFPALFGTVMMVLIMSVIVTPFGVLAAFYLREYAKQGPFVSAVRIAVNNLAGVPSIVFGVFGLGFFIYIVGGSIDRIFFPESLPTPTFGTGGILWASLTLALLTVPVVIVATEEGLAAVPRSVREGSLALGATKFETTMRVVLPAVLPSILTGLILAMARAAGEVAPLMITGVVKLAPSLPVDGFAPFVHLERKFMHLGFHIYDVGFQSPNVDAARPMVFATTLLLLAIVLVLNLAAIWLRNRLRRRYATSAI